MPFNYAHYRFGAAQLAAMPADTRRTIQRFRQLYDMGLHGPDIFMCYSPVIASPINALSKKFHGQSGRDFFTRVVRSLRLDPSEAGYAYLYGLLCHYALDSLVHPYVLEGVGHATHIEIEVEFDRFLLERDGKIPPNAQDLSRHIRLTSGECQTVAGFYPGATAGQVRTCVRNMAFVTRLGATPEGPQRRVLARSLGLGGKKLSAFLMTSGPNPRCAALDEGLLARYTLAEASFPALLEQLQAHLTYNAPLGELFDAPFL